MPLGKPEGQAQRAETPFYQAFRLLRLVFSFARVATTAAQAAARATAASSHAAREIGERRPPPVQGDLEPTAEGLAGGRRYPPTRSTIIPALTGVVGAVINQERIEDHAALVAECAASISRRRYSVRAASRSLRLAKSALVSCPDERELAVEVVSGLGDVLLDTLLDAVRAAGVDVARDASMAAAAMDAPERRVASGHGRAPGGHDRAVDPRR
jgi:hypothetical protein